MRAARIPSSIETPLPSIVLVRIRAPAAAANSGVPSIEPSSTTMTSVTRGSRRVSSTTDAIVADSLSAGMMTVIILVSPTANRQPRPDPR